MGPAEDLRRNPKRGQREAAKCAQKSKDGPNRLACLEILGFGKIQIKVSLCSSLRKRSYEEHWMVGMDLEIQLPTKSKVPHIAMLPLKGVYC